ncbi:hypothetical protein E1263_12880 [Kribbella antibiotica]|uniref:PBP domain-containing protein n=1 Tax=Kribbella antibiotica TaxID=190195 RepID=A0A4V2YPX9_9ACTN|nr:hypothetical protein [Kribbella antibiotica]TDD59987.1 hypothetical protein E1263_12880 [Kribbella antibiotica]
MRLRKLTLLAGAFVLALLAIAPVTAVARNVDERDAAAVSPQPTDTALFADPSQSPVTLSRGGGDVTVSRTDDLSRQAITVSWKGLDPSATDPGAGVTKPVLVMQCRGANPSREDCWMGSLNANGDASGLSKLQARATHYAPTETSEWWQNPANPTGRFLGIPFKKADGNPHAIHNANGTWATLPMAAAADSGGLIVPIDDFTPGTRNFRRGLTQSDGTGAVQTWVNTAAENPSLGCSETKDCSLVVVPVKDRPCLTAEDGVPAATVNACKAQVGKAGIANWQLLANWYERYVFKLSFSPSLPNCAGRNDEAKFLGSELSAEVMRRWVPARCQKSSSAALDFTRAWEPDALRQLGQRDPASPSKYAADGAIVTEPAAADDPVATDRKTAYAPIAVSGFAIGYTIDKQVDNVAGTVTDLNLNQRLVAKLLTQSYGGLFKGLNGFAVNPNTGTNPANIFRDPEFRQLNPGAQGFAGADAAPGTQLAMPVFRTDVLLAVTRWIWADPTARAFLQGQRDPWGMTVNKAYRGWQLPTDDYTLRDGWQAPTNNGVWSGFAPQSLWAQNTNSWANGADVTMAAWPLTQSPQSANTSDPNAPIVPKREVAQEFGTRNMFTLSATSELQKTGVPIANLRNSEGEYIAPTAESMGYALDGATPDQKSGVWTLNYKSMDKRGYPGTMISYAAVPTSSLPSGLARQYADNLRWLTHEGQEYGQEAGQLPDGYLALTQPMRDQANKVADAVANQTATPPIPPGGPLPEVKPTPKPTGTPTGNTNGPGQDGGGDNGNKPTATPTTPGAPTPSGGPSNKPQAQGSIKPVAATTQGDSLGWLAWGLPALLVAGLAAGVASPGIRLIAQPGHPVRRGLAGLLRRGRRRG